MDLRRFLGGADPQNNRRELVDIRGLEILTPKNERANLRVNNLRMYAQLEVSCRKGLENKFKLLKHITDDSTMEQLEAVYSVGMKVTELQDAIKQGDMDDIFIIASRYEENDAFDGQASPAAGANTINLFDDYSSVTVEQIKQASQFFMHWGADYHVESCKWSADKILNSCEESLKEKILML